MNPARVGDAALSLIYKPFQNENWKRELSITTHEPELDQIHVDGQKRNSLKLWGMENGLVSVEIGKYESGSIIDLLGKKIKWEELHNFSHVILIQEHCRTTPTFSDGDRVTTYRLTPHAKMIISAQDW